ncbi:MAG: Rrf2 family transcriptional regulator [bacterium]|nr:Rrf2 family transcriptional regulator [bacterium]
MRRVVELISRTTRYAFHLLGVLARRPHDLVRGEELFKLTGVPANYLSKIMNQLRKHGFVESQKGWGGGFRLQDAALDRPIREIVDALEGPLYGQNECAFGLPECDCDHPCPLHEKWEKVRLASDQMLEETQIGDLAFGER